MAQEPDRITVLWTEFEPRIAEAKRRDAEANCLHFVDLREERILDLPAVVLDVERYLILQQAGVFDGSCSQHISPVLLFLWIVNPGFEVDATKGQTFFKKFKRLDQAAYASGIEDYIANTFRQMPGAKDKEGQGGGGGATDWVASVVDLLASEYGWNEKKILRIPLPRLFRYVAQINYRKGGSKVMFSSEADRLRQEFMAAANASQEDVKNG